MNRETPSNPGCTRAGNRVPCWRSRPGCHQATSCTRSWMTCISSPSRSRPWTPCELPNTAWPTTLTSRSTWAKHERGMLRTRSLPGSQLHCPRTRPTPAGWGNWALPAERQGQVVLGSPVGIRAFVEATLDQVRRKHDELLPRLPELPHLQTAWLLLLYCAAPRCQYLLRTLPPAATGGYAASHDEAVLTCLATLVSGGKRP